VRDRRDDAGIMSVVAFCFSTNTLYVLILSVGPRQTSLIAACVPVLRAATALNAVCTPLQRGNKLSAANVPMYRVLTPGPWNVLNQLWGLVG
jgi:hypothetical protein